MPGVRAMPWSAEDCRAASTAAGIRPLPFPAQQFVHYLALPPELPFEMPIRGQFASSAVSICLGASLMLRHERQRFFDRRDYCEHLAVAAYLQNLPNARIRGHREHDQRLASGVGL